MGRAAHQGVDVLGLVLGATGTPSLRWVLDAKSGSYGELADPGDVAEEALDYLADGPTWICGSSNPAGGSPLGALSGPRDPLLSPLPGPARPPPGAAEPGRSGGRGAPGRRRQPAAGRRGCDSVHHRTCTLSQPYVSQPASGPAGETPVTSGAPERAQPPRGYGSLSARGCPASGRSPEKSRTQAPSPSRTVAAVAEPRQSVNVGRGSMGRRWLARSQLFSLVAGMPP